MNNIVMQQKRARASVQMWMSQYLPDGGKSIKLEALDISYMGRQMFVVRVDLDHNKIVSVPLGFNHEDEMVIVANAEFGLTYQFSKTGLYEYLFLAEMNRQRRPAWETTIN